MTENFIGTQTPQRLLLATDLSARCDRALERAKQLAQQWRASLALVTVRDGPQEFDQVLRWIDSDGKDYGDDVARRAVEKEFAGSDMQASLHIVRGEVASAIQEVAVRLDSQLIITGMARCETLGRFLLGSTTERLSRALRELLLVVRNRVSGRYQRIVIASDFSMASRRAVELVLHLFPGCDLLIYHACTPMLSNQIKEQDDTVRSSCPHAQVEGRDFLDACDIGRDARNRTRMVIEQLPLESGLKDYVRSHDVDLVVLGSKERTHLMDTLLGSAVDDLLHCLPCDTLIIPYRHQEKIAKKNRPTH